MVRLNNESAVSAASKFSQLNDPMKTRQFVRDLAVEMPVEAAAGKETLTRVGLARAIARSHTLSLRDAKSLVDMVVDEMFAALAFSGTLKLHKFGVFTVRAKAARPGRNPGTGEFAPITARRVVRFRAAAKLKFAISKGQSLEEPERRTMAANQPINLERRAKFQRFDAEDRSGEV
jgi:integration host factor subunit alpha